MILALCRGVLALRQIEFSIDQCWNLAGRVICGEDVAAAYVCQNEQTLDFSHL